LLTEDPDTEPNRIIYTVTSDPRHGYLESTRREGQEIKSFSQGKIILKHHHVYFKKIYEKKLSKLKGINCFFVNF